MALKGIIKNEIGAPGAGVENPGITITGKGYLRYVTLWVDGGDLQSGNLGHLKIYIDAEGTASTDAELRQIAGFQVITTVGNYLDRSILQHDDALFVYTYHLRVRIPFATSIKVAYKNDSGAQACTTVMSVEVVYE